MRVAIVGGGCGALSAAFELTRPEHRGRFTVTVYQMGFRLGGKGASGRGVGGRIEEHGLHLWMGFYENAFGLMRECYEELGRDRLQCPVASFQDAFAPAPFVAVTEQELGPNREPWIARFPAGAGVPGDGSVGKRSFSVADYLIKASDLLLELLRSAQGPHSPSIAAIPPGTGEAASTDWERAIEWALNHGRLASFAGLVEVVHLLQAALRWLPSRGQPWDGALSRLIDAVAVAAREQLSTTIARDSALRRTWIVVDLILASIRGCVVHGLALHPQGFDAIDDYDWRQWLALHGASRESLDSGFMRGIYDLVFAYVDGDPKRPSLSAAAALRGAMRMFFTYRGSLFWRMSAGMGDIVFSPLYEVLSRRGVRFEFFHRLCDVEVSSQAGSLPHVAALSFERQALVKDGKEYQPLVDVRGLPCWPSTPDYEQLVDGEQLKSLGIRFESPWETRCVEKRTLRVVSDFDFVVLGLGGGAMPGVSKDLVRNSPAWQAAMENLHTVATQAFQAWMTADMASLGWTHPAVNLSGWTEPFDTWADMTHLIGAETSQVAVKSIAYFCSPLHESRKAGHLTEADEGYQDFQSERVRVHAQTMLETQIAELWPAAVGPGGFRWELLADESSRTPPDSSRLGTQFWTANVRPSERYTLSLPGTQKYRLSPLDRSFDNLTVAGDWTESGLNTGCVESAVMSGRLAANALSGYPALEEIVGYDHP